MECKLPDEPVDGYRIEWFEVDGYTPQVYECSATYHINTPWADYAPKCPKHGLPIVASWMLAGRHDGRVVGWVNIAELLEAVQAFATRRAAVHEAQRQIAARLKRLREDVRELEGARARLLTR